jgi:RES domain-containing protein
MIAWRITTASRVALDGEESRENGGRWHEAGRPLVYAAASCALATLEFLAHLDGGPSDKLVAMHILIPDELRIDTMPPESLPPDWRTPRHPDCRACGQRWLERPHSDRGAVLQVPSAVVPLEFNVLIDPTHPDAAAIAVHRVHDYALDSRLI